MPKFKYTILDADGRQTSDRMSAGNAGEVAAQLRSSGKFVVSIREVETGRASSGGGLDTAIDLSALLPFGRAKKKDIVLMFRQLAVLLKSGVSVLRAFQILERQSRKRGMIRLLHKLQKLLESGESLSQAMAANKGAFSPFMISMVQAAETSGELDSIMEQIADQLEASLEFRQTMITSMIYPSLVVVMTVVAIAMLTLVVIPKFVPILAGAGRQMPWATQVVVDATKWAKAYGKLTLLGLVGLVVVLPVARKTEEGGLLIDRLLLKIPLIGMILKCGMVVNFTRNLATLFASGVAISDALQTVRGTVSNHAGARVIDKMVENIVAGGSLAEPLQEADHIFPPMVGEMLATSEETGEVERVLLLTAQIHQKMLETYVKRMNAMIEPLLIMSLGSIVGFVFYALLVGMMAVYGV